MTTNATTDFSVPMEVSDVDIAFPASVKRLMPAYEDIPSEFKGGRGLYNRVTSQWFFGGLPSDIKFHLVDGVDGDKMIRHLKCILGSFEPKHEHKEAAVAYLLSIWCSDITDWEKK